MGKKDEKNPSPVREGSADEQASSNGIDNSQEADYNDEEIVVEELSDNDALKKLREKLKQCVSEKQEYVDGWQRAKADFINYKKSEEERKSDILKFAKEDLVNEILPVLDSFNMAKKSDDWSSGTEVIFKQFVSILEKNGLEEMNPLEEDFDPNEHEAVQMVEGDEGKIMEVIQIGYKLNNKIIRPAKVVVGK